MVDKHSNYNRQSQDFNTASGFQATQMPIKNRVSNLKRLIMVEFTKDLNENKKESQLLRSECATLEHHLTESTNDILKHILEDISNLEKDFHKVMQMDEHEMTFLKQQAQQLQQEKQKLQQSCVLLDNRVHNVEHDVGFE